MRTSTVLGALALAALVAEMAGATTLDDVRARGVLRCGVNGGLAGFGVADSNGKWSGFDVDLCRAVAAAVLEDPASVEFVPTTVEDSYAVLADEEVDLLVRNATATYSRDAGEPFDFVAINYYDGQGFMVSKESGVSSATELNDAAVCFLADTMAEKNLANYFKAHNMSYDAVPVRNDAEAQQQYLAGACNAITGDASVLAAARATMAEPDGHVVLPEIISKEPHGPVVRHGDNRWGDIVRWTFFALVIAEEKGVTRANIEEVAAATSDPETRRLLGVEGDMGEKAGLDAEAFRRAIAANGNYGEIFEANIGASTPIGLVRGLNALWSQGGLQYAWPMR